jgi:hypothetical protein
MIAKRALKQSITGLRKMIKAKSNHYQQIFKVVEREASRNSMP